MRASEVKRTPLGVGLLRSVVRAALIGTDPAARTLADVRDLTVMGRRCRLYRPAAALPGSLPGLVYMHGGGLFVGDVETHDSLCRRLCAASGASILSVDYRKAPEAKWPAQLDDARNACAWAVRNTGELGWRSDCLGVGGDSAGAYLAVRAAADVQADWAVQVLFAPLHDFNSDAWRVHPSRTAGLAGGLALSVIRRQIDASPPPLQNFVREGAPATVLVTGRFDPVSAGALAYGAKLKAVGVRVVHVQAPLAPHGVLNVTAFRQTRAALIATGRAVASFYDRARLDRQPRSE